MKNRFFVDYLGCKVNSYEVNALKEELLKKGFLFDSENPDFIILNSCSVTSSSDKKSRNLTRFYRKNHPNATLIVAGCSTQSSDENVYLEAGADVVLGTNNKAQIIDIIESSTTNETKTIYDVDPKFREFNYEEISEITQFDQVRAYVKIQDGCDNFCSYCLIPYIRGVSRSRNKENIIKEIGNLIKNGYKEVVLTGIDVASYGLDFKNGSNFSSLLKEILENHPNLERLRISSIEESMIDDEFLELLKKYPNICDHMHLSLQSGSNSVLKRMNRKYKTEEFYEKVLKIKSARPNMCLSTDIIVGFPGETVEEFNETVEFAKKCRFSKIHVFPYSIRKNTVAAKMKDQIAPSIKKERVNTLLKLSKELENQYISRFLGQELEFLIEQFDRNTKKFKGHSSNYLECSVESDENLVNKIVKKVVNFDSVKIS